MTAAQSGDEPFETFTDTGLPLGVRRRADVHRRGDWHKAANVLLRDGRGRLWLQRRAAGKDLWPLAWDVSVGEHLVPGETFIDGALRGLAEELGVRGVPLTPLGGVVRASFAIPADGVRDNELQQSFTGVWDGVIDFDEGEVAEVRPVQRNALLAELRDGHERFTPWLRARVGLLGW